MQLGKAVFVFLGLLFQHPELHAAVKKVSRVVDSNGHSFLNPEEYVWALKHPDHRISLAIKKAQVLLHPGSGAEQMWQGPSASVFLMAEEGGVPFALRVFHPNNQQAQSTSSLRNLNKRWPVLAAYMKKLSDEGRLPFVLHRFEYLRRAIKFDGIIQPAMKELKVEGVSLGEWLAVKSDSTEPRDRLDLWLMSILFRAAMKQLKTVQFSHGDLSDRNFRVDSEARLHLIDYAPAWIPPLQGFQSDELGTRDFQHPQVIRDRRRSYGANMDHFSSLVIYISLLALFEDPTRWARFHRQAGTEGFLLFTDRDYQKPENSALFQELEDSGIDRIKYLTMILKEVIKSSPDECPSLEENIRLSKQIKRVLENARRTGE